MENSTSRPTRSHGSVTVTSASGRRADPRPPGVGPTPTSSWHYHNADGTAAEMCGNGIRCFAKYVVDRGLLDEERRRSDGRDPWGRQAHHSRARLGRAHADGDRRHGRTDPRSRGDPHNTHGGDRSSTVRSRPDSGPSRSPRSRWATLTLCIWVDDVYEAPVETVGPAIENHAGVPDEDERRVRPVRRRRPHPAAGVGARSGGDSCVRDRGVRHARGRHALLHRRSLGDCGTPRRRARYHAGTRTATST